MLKILQAMLAGEVIAGLLAASSGSPWPSLQPAPWLRGMNHLRN
jgi:hypothetical protein